MGIQSFVPTNAVKDLATGEVLWGEPDSVRNITRKEFAWKYGWDPWTVWCRLPRNRNSPICKGYEDRCKAPKKPPQKPLTSEDMLDLRHPIRILTQDSE